MRLLHSAFSTGILKAFGLGLGLLTSAFTARILGASDFGTLSVALAIGALLAIPTGLGVPPLLVRLGANHPGSLTSLRRWADRLVVPIGLAMALSACIAAMFAPAHEIRMLLLAAAPIPLLLTVLEVRQSLVQARGWTFLSQWPRLALQPSLALLGVAVLYFTIGEVRAFHALAVYAASYFASCLVLGSHLRSAVLGGDLAQPVDGAAVRNALPFMWLTGLYLVNSRVDLLLLSTLAGAEQAGLYAVALRISDASTFFVALTNVTIAASVARAPLGSASLQVLVSTAARNTFLATALLAAACFLAAPRLLETFFGAEYGQSAPALRILLASQVLAAALGPAGVLLNMTGHAATSARAFLFCVLLNAMLNVLLIPIMGLQGAAWATGTSLVICAAIRGHLAWRRLGVRAGVFPLLGR